MLSRGDLNSIYRHLMGNIGLWIILQTTSPNLSSRLIRDDDTFVRDCRSGALELFT